MWWGQGGDSEAGTRAFSLTRFNLLTKKEGWTCEDLGSLSLTTHGLMTFDKGTGSINLWDNQHGSLTKGKSWVEIQPF